MISDTDYQFIRELVYRRSRINLGDAKKELVSARLGKRLRATNLSSISDYCRFLQTSAGLEEGGHLIDAISTNHTYFFREESHFAALRELILPELLARRASEKWPELRVWSAACSSGEEPYSIAISLDQQLRIATGNWPWSILATDISSRILAKARAGLYSSEAVAKIDRPLISTYFKTERPTTNGGRNETDANAKDTALMHRIIPSLATRVRFQQGNLLAGELPREKPFHIIFCRNVMIYFDRQTQEELVSRLSSCLVPGGWLLVGHSESLSSIRHSLKMIKPATYRAGGFEKAKA